MPRACRNACAAAIGRFRRDPIHRSLRFGRRSLHAGELHGLHVEQSAAEPAESGGRYTGFERCCSGDGKRRSAGSAGGSRRVRQRHCDRHRHGQRIGQCLGQRRRRHRPSRGRLQRWQLPAGQLQARLRREHDLQLQLHRWQLQVHLREGLHLRAELHGRQLPRGVRSRRQLQRRLLRRQLPRRLPHRRALRNGLHRRQLSGEVRQSRRLCRQLPRRSLQGQLIGFPPVRAWNDLQARDDGTAEQRVKRSASSASLGT
jgi:hypothetical protein